MSNQNQCSHNRILSIITDHPGGTKSQHWECPDCNTQFCPETTDMHRIRLRDNFAAKAMQSFLDKLEPEIMIKHGEKVIIEITDIAYSVADQMLVSRNKTI